MVWYGSPIVINSMRQECPEVKAFRVDPIMTQSDFFLWVSCCAKPTLRNRIRLGEALVVPGYTVFIDFDDLLPNMPITIELPIITGPRNRKIALGIRGCNDLIWIPPFTRCVDPLSMKQWRYGVVLLSEFGLRKTPKYPYHSHQKYILATKICK